ncbi:MAG: LysR family transcriptional regulator [Pseudomonadota bacterium]
MRAFLVTAEEGSLSAAARELSQSQPTLSRQVSALEEELGVALFERGPAGLELTPNGLALLHLARDMGECANKLSMAATGQSQAIEGSVCISATEIAASYILPPIIQALRTQEPGIEIEVVASQQASDLRRREADVAIRAFRPTQPYLIARRLGESHHHLYASRAYLKAIDWPRAIDDLDDVTFLGFDRTEALIDACRSVGLELAQNHFPIIVHDWMVQWSMARAGLGIAIMLEKVALQEPDMVRAFPEADPMVTENWLVTHRELHTSRRVRFVYDFLVDRLAET